MTAFSEPTKWAQALGATANADVIPDEAGATEVDISKIFPAVFSVPLSQGGKAIPRRTLNGIFKTLGEWAFYNQNGGVPSYNADFDYTVGRLVSYNGSLYKCIQDNVHTAPHNPTDKDYWAELSDSSSSTGLLPNQIITSPVPLSDANLHLLDGSVLTSGVYAEYVAMMIRLYNADPTASCWISEADWQTSVSTYGECGKFVVDTVNNTVRLPKLTSFIQATSTASELGSLTEAGVPNITAGLINHNDINYVYGASANGDWTGYNTSINGASDNGTITKSTFDASRSSPVYGKSNTVQPQSIKYYYYIVVGTVSKSPVQVDIDTIATDLNNKADRSLSNVDNTANILMAHNAMPSNAYDDLTLGASGSTYTAPADGYFFLDKSVNYVGQWIYMTGVMGSTVLSPDSTASLITFVPVQKGQQITINYTAAGNTNRFMFIYAVGSESEKV
jgi:hypothetical protein